jgi:hypothetical protein
MKFEETQSKKTNVHWTYSAMCSVMSGLWGGRGERLEVILEEMCYQFL